MSEATISLVPSPPKPPRDQRRIPPAEAMEFPWWVIIDPDRIKGLRDNDGRISGVAGAVIGPFFSRDSAEAHLRAKAHRYSPRALVFGMTGHDSADWRAFCLETVR
jgi:hypothetical protein